MKVGLLSLIESDVELVDRSQVRQDDVPGTKIVGEALEYIRSGLASADWDQSWDEDWSNGGPGGCYTCYSCYE